METQSVRITTSRRCGKGKRAAARGRKERFSYLPALITKSAGEENPFSYAYTYMYFVDAVIRAFEKGSR